MRHVCSPNEIKNVLATLDSSSRKIVQRSGDRSQAQPLFNNGSERLGRRRSKAYNFGSIAIAFQI
jgi:hypothetical protein